MKESIIFDLDGTLWDTSEEIEQVLKNVAQNYNIKVDANTILGINKREDCKSIDTRLAKMEKEKRAYFTASFLFMLENAEAIV